MKFYSAFNFRSVCSEYPDFDYADFEKWAFKYLAERESIAFGFFMYDACLLACLLLIYSDYLETINNQYLSGNYNERLINGSIAAVLLAKEIYEPSLYIWGQMSEDFKKGYFEMRCANLYHHVMGDCISSWNDIPI